jgi:cytoskeletal protein CcmA (bactofilin family)
MSMFTRNDKVTDTNIGTNTGTNTGTGTNIGETAGESVRVQETPSVSAIPAARPAQAMAQPLSNIAASRAAGVSVISKALKITGQLESTEDIRIDGEVEGDVRGVSVTVGSGAKIKGTVYGDVVELSGTIEGKIEAEKVLLTSSAHMSGDVIHQDIKIESGAFIDGHCRPEYGKNKTAHSASRSSAPSAGPGTQVK